MSNAPAGPPALVARPLARPARPPIAAVEAIPLNPMPPPMVYPPRPPVLPGPPGPPVAQHAPRAAAAPRAVAPINGPPRPNLPAPPRGPAAAPQMARAPMFPVAPRAVPAPPQAALQAQLAGAVARPRAPLPAHLAAQQQQPAAAVDDADLEGRFAWRPGMPELGDDRVRDANVRAVARRPDLAAEAGEAPEDLANEMEQAQRARLRAKYGPDLLALKAARHQWEGLVEQLRSLSPLPHRRISLQAAQALLRQAAQLRASFPGLSSDDWWIGAIGWPESVLSRLRNGVDVYLAAQQALDAALQKLLANGVAVDSPSGDAPTGVPRSADIFAAMEPLSKLLFLCERVDSACCYIEDMSESISYRALLALRAAADKLVELMGDVVDKLRMRSGVGAKLDAVGRVRAVQSTAKQLLQLHEQVAERQKSRALWAAGRASVRGEQWVRLANGGAHAAVVTPAGFSHPTTRETIIQRFAEHGYLTAREGDSAPAFAGLLNDPKLRALLAHVSGYGPHRYDAGGGLAAADGVSDPDEIVRLFEQWRIERAAADEQALASMSAAMGVASEHKDALDRLLESIRRDDTSTAVQLLQQGEGVSLGDVVEAQESAGAGAGAAAAAEAVQPSPLACALTSSGNSAILLAISKGNVPVVQALLKYGYTVSMIHLDGSTALHMAASKGGAVGLQLMQLLLAALSEQEPELITRQAVLDSRNDAGNTALHLAARSAVNTATLAVHNMMILIEAGADPLVTDAARKTALQVCQPLHFSTQSAAATAQAAPSSGAAATAASSSTSTTAPTSASFNAATAIAHPLSAYVLSPMFSDVTLVVQADGDSAADEGGGAAAAAPTEELPAHRIVLASHSAFFKALLEGQWREAVTGRVVLPDLRAGVSRVLMQCCYEGREPPPTLLVPGDLSTGIPLLQATLQYDMPAVCKMVQGVLLRWLDVGNAAPLVAACGSHRSQCSILYPAAMAFLMQHYAEIHKVSGAVGHEELVSLLATAL